MLQSRLASLLIVLCLCVAASAKICWKECKDDGTVSSANVIGCRRRTGRNGRTPRFRCDGTRGPPCTVKRGDTVYLDVDFTADAPIANMTQEAFWVTNWGIELPWAGMDNKGCPYLKQNECETGTTGNMSFEYPIEISKFYPTGKYNLKWVFSDGSGENKTQITCFRFVIRIV